MSVSRPQPAREEVCALAESGCYHRVPVCCELHADGLTTIWALRALRTTPGTWL